MNKNKSLTIEETFNLAVKNHQEGKTDIAQDLYNQVLKNNPNHSQAINNLGIIFKGLGDNQKARTMSEAKQAVEGQYSNAKTVILTRVPS